MKYLILLLLLLASPVQADIYLDVAAEVHQETKDSFYQSTGEPITNFIGMVEVGYEWDNKSVFFRHMSSVQQEDVGLNTIGFKVRVW